MQGRIHNTILEHIQRIQCCTTLRQAPATIVVVNLVLLVVHIPLQTIRTISAPDTSCLDVITLEEVGLETANAVTASALHAHRFSSRLELVMVPLVLLAQDVVIFKLVAEENNGAMAPQGPT